MSSKLPAKISKRLAELEAAESEAADRIEAAQAKIDRLRSEGRIAPQELRSLQDDLTTARADRLPVLEQLAAFLADELAPALRAAEREHDGQPERILREIELEQCQAYGYCPADAPPSPENNLIRWQPIFGQRTPRFQQALADQRSAKARITAAMDRAKRLRELLESERRELDKLMARI